MIRTLLLALLLLPDPTAAQTPPPLPVDLGGAFALVDQYGNPRDQTDPGGRAQLLFFGYANCPGICTMTLPAMADATDLLARRGITLSPVLITVDPARDRVGTMTGPLARLHPDFVGLTGSEPALAAARSAFSVERKLLFTDPEQGAVFSHGSFVYLLGADGTVLTLMPPTLGPDRMAAIAATYLTDGT